MGAFLAALPAMFAGTAGGAAGGTAAAGAITASQAAGLAAAAQTMAAGTAIELGATGAITQAAAAPITAATLVTGAAGAATPTAAALAGGTAGGLSGILTPALVGTGLAGSAGMQAYSGIQQEQMLKAQAKAEQRQTAAQQMEYQSKLRQVLSMNTADAAARGLLPGGSFSAVQQSMLEGGAAALGQAEGDLRRKLALYSAARQNALMSGYGGAGMQGLGLAGVLSGGKVVI